MSEANGRRSLVVAWLVIAAVVVAMASGFFLPRNISIAPLAPIAVAAAAVTRRRRLVWGLALGLVVAGYATLFVAPDGLQPDHGMGLLLLNRTLAGGATFVTAAIADLWIASQEALSQERSLLREHNLLLENTNAALTARETEIAAQNEQLQVQGEELERQGDELRVVNDDLASRERVLAQLLELSRSLAVEVTSADVMARICQSLSTAVSPRATASALLMREGETMRIVCHVGFGDAPPDVDVIPLTESFGSLLMSRGQTGFLHDLALRPDLRVPQPRSGERFSSVLGAPLWVRGQPVGTLEAYGSTPVHWSDQDVGLVTSMAAQASTSLQTAQLFEELEQGRRRFEAVFRDLPVAVLVADDPDCRHVSGNPAAAALFNTAADANFSPFAQPGALVRREYFERGRRLGADNGPLVQASRHGQEIRGLELEVVLASGKRTSVLVSAAPIYDQKGRIEGAVATYADISLQKAIERQLEARRREVEEESIRKTRFLAAVSHDIRTPANAIRLQAELIRRSAADTALAPRLPKLAGDIQGSAITLVELVTEMLDLTRLDTGRMELHESEFSLGETLAEEIRSLTALAQSKSLALECVPLAAPIWLRTDRVKLGRVTGNLLENAIKFTERGGVHTGAETLADGTVRIAVWDTGPGIPREHLPHIFDEFFQLRNPERDRTKGRGMGLAICKRLVDALGGEIGVESDPGRGTRFTVTLPATHTLPNPDAHRPLPTAEGPTPAGRSLAGVRVLVAEDHLPTRQAVAQILSAEGAMVVEVEDGLSALAAIDAERPDLLLLDLMMPTLDGVEVLRALHDRTPQPALHIVVLTGDRASRDPDELRRLGAAAVVSKPVEPGRLIALLRDVMATA